MRPECELCGRRAPLSIAQLRVAFEDCAILVKVCSGCSAGAWRTIGEWQEEKRQRAAPPRPGARVAAAFVCEARA